MSDHLMDKPVLEAKGIYKTFTHPAHVEVLKGVSLTVRPGESLAIMGASGEGKSTLLQILGTLETPTSGDLFIAGEQATSKKAPFLRNKYLGFVFQSFHLLDDYTALQNVLMPGLIAGDRITKTAPAYRRGCELLDKVGLSERAHFSTKLLSGGEKQRVAIARALFNDPAILLADEPSGNLDQENANKIYELLFYCTQELKKALIIVTHDVKLASLCQVRCKLSKGLLYPEAVY